MWLIWVVSVLLLQLSQSFLIQRSKQWSTSILARPAHEDIAISRKLAEWRKLKKEGVLGSVESIVLAMEKNDANLKGTSSVSTTIEGNATLVLRSVLRKGEVANSTLLISLLGCQAVDWKETMVSRYVALLGDPAFCAAVPHEDALRSMLRGKPPPLSLPTILLARLSERGLLSTNFEHIFRLTLRVMQGEEDAAELAEVQRQPALYSLADLLQLVRQLCRRGGDGHLLASAMLSALRPAHSLNAEQLALFVKNLVLHVGRERRGVAMKELPTSVAPEVVLLGRSNAGKSSLLNCLLGRSKLAPVSRVPGETQALVFYPLQLRRTATNVTLVDSVGLGYAATLDEPPVALMPSSRAILPTNHSPSFTLAGLSTPSDSS
eukprot:gene34821-42170_t